jgi:hypothetical protein
MIGYLEPMMRQWWCLLLEILILETFMKFNHMNRIMLNSGTQYLDKWLVYENSIKYHEARSFAD